MLYFLWSHQYSSGPSTFLKEVCIQPALRDFPAEEQLVSPEKNVHKLWEKPRGLSGKDARLLPTNELEWHQWCIIRH